MFKLIISGERCLNILRDRVEYTYETSKAVKTECNKLVSPQSSTANRL